MIVYIILDGVKHELLDREAVFEEGEKVIVTLDNGARESHTITSVSKVLTGKDSLDVCLEVQLL